MSDRRANLVLIHTHDTRRHLGCYGAPVASPHLDSLAREGVLFRKAFCASPGCSASRASMLTGLWPHQNGVTGLVHHGFALVEPRRHLSFLLRERGYATRLVGFQHEAPWGHAAELLGYDHAELEIHQGRIPLSATRAEAACRWLDAAPRESFFLNVGFVETHHPFLDAEAPDDPRYVAPLPWLPDLPAIREDMAKLRTAVRHVDDAVGMILAAIARNGLSGRTVVVFTTDHGLPFLKAKSTLYDAGIEVACIVRGPPPFAAGRVVDAQIGHIDLLPTLFPLLGLVPPPGLQGIDLAPVLAEPTRARPSLVAMQTFHDAYDPCRALRTERYKYIRSWAERPRLVLTNVDNCATKTALGGSGVGADPRPREQLFDLLADPLEFRDRSGDPALAEVKAGLAGELERWMAGTGDPLLHGAIAPPAGWIPAGPDRWDAWS